MIFRISLTFDYKYGSDDQQFLSGMKLLVPILTPMNFAYLSGDIKNLTIRFLIFEMIFIIIIYKSI